MFDKDDKIKLKVLANKFDALLSDIYPVSYEKGVFEYENYEYEVYEEYEFENHVYDVFCEKLKHFDRDVINLIDNYETYVKEDILMQERFKDVCYDVCDDLISDLTLEEFIDKCIEEDLADPEDFEQGGAYDISGLKGEKALAYLRQETVVYDSLVCRKMDEFVPDDDYIDWYIDFEGTDIYELFDQYANANDIRNFVIYILGTNVSEIVYTLLECSDYYWNDYKNQNYIILER